MSLNSSMPRASALWLALTLLALGLWVVLRSFLRLRNFLRPLLGLRVFLRLRHFLRTLLGLRIVLPFAGFPRSPLLVAHE